MKGSFEVRWEVPGKLVRDNHVVMTETFLETEYDKALQRYRELRSGQFNYKIRLTQVQRYCAESKNDR